MIVTVVSWRWMKVGDSKGRFMNANEGIMNEDSNGRKLNMTEGRRWSV